jgi:tetratricopeptide (TPR) repeat protein
MDKNKPLFLIWLAAVTAFSLNVSAQTTSAGRDSLLAAKPGVKKLTPLTPQEDLSMEPDPADVFDQAVKAYAAGRMPEAEKLFLQVVKLDPRNADAQFNLGAIKEWANDLPGALDHYQAAAILKPGDHDIQEAVRAVIYKIKNKGALEAQAQREKQAEEMSLHSQMAKSAFSSENYSEAIRHLSYLVKAMPDDAKIQFALGQSYRAMKVYDRSAYRLKLAVYLEPDNDLYRQSLVDLDREIMAAQGEAYQQSAQTVLHKVEPLSFPEVAQTGTTKHE